MLKRAALFLQAVPLLGCALISSIAQADAPAPRLTVSQTQRGVVFAGGFMTQERHYGHHLATLAEHFDDVRFVAAGQNPLSPDHVADFERVEQAYLDLQQSGATEIFAVGYSLGGKLVSRLALRHTELSGLVLLDPVDGGPDAGPGGKTPAFLTDTDEITVPTLILWSENGEKAKLFGKPCVTPGFGSGHFLNHIRSDALYGAEELPGTSHLNFLMKPWNPMMKIACDNGTADDEQIAAKVRDLVVDFVHAR